MVDSDVNLELRKQQEELCGRFATAVMESPDELKVGISKNVREGAFPINGVRVQPENDTTGWYLWVGEWSDDPDFFVPLHVKHLAEWCPVVIPYLLLPTGWRFQLAPNHEDVWLDETVQSHASTNARK